MFLKTSFKMESFLNEIYLMKHDSHLLTLVMFKWFCGYILLNICL